MQIKLDTAADALYIKIKKGKVEKTLNKEDSFLIDLDKKGKVLGFEILNYSKTVPKSERSSVLIDRTKVTLPV